MHLEANTIVIQGEGSSVTLEVLRRQFPDHLDYWDGNWMVTRFQARASWFQAEFTETVHLRELIGLREELAEMHARLDGRVEWKAMDGFLELVAVMDKLGHIRWDVELTYHVEEGSRLSMEIHNDQTYLPAILSQIDAVLETFPLQGQPE